MDYDGQAKAEKLSRVIITLFGVVGLIWGYVIQQYYYYTEIRLFARKKYSYVTRYSNDKSLLNNY